MLPLHAELAKTASTGIVYLTSSGKRLANSTLGCPSAGVIRTVSLGLRRQGFLDYLWLTDYEITDPALSGDNATACTFHAWEWNSDLQQVRAEQIRTRAASCTGRRRPS